MQQGGGGGGFRPMSPNPLTRHLSARRHSLPDAALQRYARHYGLADVGPRQTLLNLVNAHFAGEPVDENAALTAFVRTTTSQRGMTTPPDKLSPKRRGHDSNITPTPRKAPRKAARALTYGDMISSALGQLPGQQGTLVRQAATLAPCLPSPAEALGPPW